MTVHIIRTSDRLQFKKCRRAWDIGSKIRQDLEPKAVRTPLDFGTEIHAAMEKWYDPQLWTTDPKGVVREQLAILAFKDSWKSHWKMYEENGVLSEETKMDMQQRMDLGVPMIENYARWSRVNDKRYTPVYVEIEFEVPLGYWVGDRVDYQGRIDLIFQDDLGRYWIVDHKTAARLQENTSWLEMDEQMKSYAWAIQHKLGIKIAGVLYNELYKGVPSPPERLQRPRKGLSFSVSKSADTTFELALETFKKEDRTAFKAGWYDDYLTYLKESGGKQFIRRTSIMYTQKMLEILGEQIAEESVDMLDNPRVYPNPTKFGCDWCDHRMLCLAMNDGQDQEWIKEAFYIKRTKTKV